MTSSQDTAVQDPVDAQLDQEINDIKTQMTKLYDRRALLSSTLFSTNADISTIIDAAESNNIAEQLKKHLLHKQENLYRLAAGVTTFSVRDPDPNAVDEGRILGVRIEVCTNGKFQRPYYVFLTKPYPDPTRFKVHRHTVPPSIHLAQLAAMHLPDGRAGNSEEEESKVPPEKQDLMRFVQALRNEITNYHHRLSAIASLANVMSLNAPNNIRSRADKELILRNISAADAEAKHVTLEWEDGRIGRLITNDKGDVVDCIVVNSGVRDRVTEAKIVAHRGNLESYVLTLL